MHRRLHTTRVLILVLIATLLSSTVMSAPLMQIQDSNLVTVPTQHHETHCDSSQTGTTHSEQECCDLESMPTEHQCCTSSNAIGYSILSESVSLNQPASSLNRIPTEPSTFSSAFSNQPFRPPIS